jgi:RNA polymerase-associated protein CTR9
MKYERNDPFTFCALGWLHFTLGREAKSSSELAERPKQYLRSAEAYERALTLDPKSAMAAQGLAIALAEDTLSQPGSVSAADEPKVRMKLAGHALGIFSRINDCLLDGSGNVNMGHCHFTRGDEEKAIQAVCPFLPLTRTGTDGQYEAALTLSKNVNVPILLYLARAWYAWATRESNISGMAKALSYCQQVSPARGLMHMPDKIGNAYPAIRSGNLVQYRHDPTEIGRTVVLARTLKEDHGGITSSHRSRSTSCQVSCLLRRELIK